MPLDQIMNMRYKHDLLQYIRKISESEYEGLEKHFRNQDEDFKNVFDGHVEKQLITNIFLWFIQIIQNEQDTSAKQERHALKTFLFFNQMLLQTIA